MAIQLLPLVGIGVRKAAIWLAESAVMQRAGNLVSQYLGGEDQPATDQRQNGRVSRAEEAEAVTAVTGSRHKEDQALKAEQMKQIAQVADAVHTLAQDVLNNPNKFRPNLETLNLAVASLKELADKTKAPAAPAPDQKELGPENEAPRHAQLAPRRSSPSFDM